MSSKDKQIKKVIEWVSVRKLIKNFQMKQSALDEVFEIIQDLPQVPPE